MSDTDERVRVTIADDHPVFLAGLRQMLETLGGFEVAGTADTGPGAVALARAERPDVAVLDLHMPGLNGVDAARAIHAELPRTGILMLTMVDDDESVFAAMRAGARGYLLKGAGPREIVHAVNAVAAGAAVFGPSIAGRIVEFLGAPRPVEAFEELTGREREILALIAGGHGNAAIAERLHLSPKTVRNHVSSILAKLRVADRAAAMLRARAGGLGES